MNRGRPKKTFLNDEEMVKFNSFQDTLKNTPWKFNDLLFVDGRDVSEDFVVTALDTEFTKIQKMLRFKHYVLKSFLTHDECSYLVDVNEKGTHPTEENHLTKMAICKIEQRAMAKLREALGKKFNIYKFDDVYNGDNSRSSLTPVDLSKKSFSEE